MIFDGQSPWDNTWQPLWMSAVLKFFWLVYMAFYKYNVYYNGVKVKLIKMYSPYRQGIVNIVNKLIINYTLGMFKYIHLVSVTLEKSEQQQ